MNGKKYNVSQEVTTNIDKIKLTLKGYRSKQEYGKDLFSSLIAFLSILFTVLSSNFKDMWGIPSNYLGFIVWAVIAILGLNILYLIFLGIMTAIKKNNSVDWFVDALLGNDNSIEIRFVDLMGALSDSLVTVVYWIWKSIGYMILFIFYTIPIIILIMIGINVGWSELLVIHAEDEVPYLIPYIFFGFFGIGIYYSIILVSFECFIHESVRDFFEYIFDIEAIR